MLQRARIERNKLAMATPPMLTYDKASNSGALEDWIDSMELLFDQLGVDSEEDEARMSEIAPWVDRDVRTWWKGQQEQARADGQPIEAWEQFLEVLRAQFLPQSEAQAATSELINIRQHQGEPMEQYFLRATRLFARTRGEFPDKAAMLVVLDRVRKDEWRNALAVATREVQTQKITTLAQLRACLQREALAEPGKQQQRQQSSGAASSSAPQKPTGGAHQKRPQSLRAAAAARSSADDGSAEEEAAETGSAPGGATTTKAAAATAPQKTKWAGDRCARCKETGHRAADCSKPDKRLCYVCGETGHISTVCSKRAQPKNE